MVELIKYSTASKIHNVPNFPDPVTNEVCSMSHSNITNTIMKCDRIWENLRLGFFYENRVWGIFDKLYDRANYLPSLRPIAHFAWELACFGHDRATPTIIEKLRSKGVAMHAYSVSVYYAWTGNQLNGPGRSCWKWTPKVALGSNFVDDNEWRFFFDT